MTGRFGPPRRKSLGATLTNARWLVPLLGMYLSIAGVRPPVVNKPGRWRTDVQVPEAGRAVALPLASVPSGLNATESGGGAAGVGWPSGRGAGRPQPTAGWCRRRCRWPACAHWGERHRIDVGCAAGQGLAERTGCADRPSPGPAGKLPLAACAPSGLNAPNGHRLLPVRPRRAGGVPGSAHPQQTVPSRRLPVCARRG
jgi:hypothetical protein